MPNTVELSNQQPRRAVGAPSTLVMQYFQVSTTPVCIFDNDVPFLSSVVLFLKFTKAISYVIQNNQLALIIYKFAGFLFELANQSPSWEVKRYPEYHNNTFLCKNSSLCVYRVFRGKKKLDHFRNYKYNRLIGLGVFRRVSLHGRKLYVVLSCKKAMFFYVLVD